MATATENATAVIDEPSVGYDPASLGGAKDPDALDDKNYRSDPRAEDYAWDTGAPEEVVAPSEETTEPTEGQPAPITEGEPVAGDAFDDELLSTARELGFSDQEARAFGTPENLVKGLSRLIDSMESKAAARSDEPVKATDKSLEIPVLDVKALLLDPEKVDPELAAMFNGAIQKIHEHYSAKTAFIEKAIGQLGLEFQNSRQNVMVAEAQAFEQRFRGYVKALPDAYRVELGGDLSEVPRGSKQWNAQVRVVETMTDLQNTRLGSGKSEAELATLAAQLVLGDKAKTIARQEVVTKLKDRAKQAIGGTTQRNGKPVSGINAAIKTVERFQRQIGAMPE